MMNLRGARISIEATRAVTAGRSVALGLAAWLCAGLPLGSAGEPSLAEEVSRLSSEVESAREKHDGTALLVASRRLAELLPNNPRALIQLARALVQSGQTSDAIGRLEQVAGMGLAVEIEREQEFQDLRTIPGFRDIVSRLESNRAPAGGGAIAFTLTEKDLLTEGIAHDRRTGAFYVSSVHRRKIVRIDRDGSTANFVAEGEQGLLGVLGLGIDIDKRVLWATSLAVPQMRGFRKQDEGRSFLVELDLDSGRVRRMLEPPAGALLGDLTVGPGGVVYISDMKDGRICVLRPKAGALEILVKKGSFLSPQGLTCSSDTLFIADYALGIARVDAEGGTVDWLEAPSDVALYGIDGLVESGDWLVGVQNALPPHRVVAFRLDERRSRVLEARVLARAHPAFDEPTLAARVGDKLYVVARSQWERFHRDGSVDRANLQPPVVLTIPLDDIVR
jgi:sugar lactone lactonase YvrE